MSNVRAALVVPALAAMLVGCRARPGATRTTSPYTSIAAAIVVFSGSPHSAAA